MSQSIETLEHAPGPERIAHQRAKLLQLHSLVQTRARSLVERAVRAAAWRLAGDDFALSDIERVAPTNTTVLIFGESGTGKELIARTIHDKSTRRRAWCPTRY